MQPRIQLSALLWIIVALTEIKRIQRHPLPKRFACEIKMTQEIFFYVFTGTRGSGELQVDLCNWFVTEIKSVFAQTAYGQCLVTIGKRVWLWERLVGKRSSNGFSSTMDFLYTVVPEH